jgi:hypothetical protein
MKSILFKILMIIWIIFGGLILLIILPLLLIFFIAGILYGQVIYLINNYKKTIELYKKGFAYYYDKINILNAM